MQRRVHSVELQRFTGNGCTIYEHTRAHPPVEGEPCEVVTEQGKVLAQDVLVCTHSPYFAISELDVRVAPYQSYVITARVADEIPDALFWDDAKPYHYIRQASAGDPKLLIIGGEDHKTGQGGDEREPFQRLERYAHQRFAVQKIEHRWSAELFEPADGLPLVGRRPFSKRLYGPPPHDLKARPLEELEPAIMAPKAL